LWRRKLNIARFRGLQGHLLKMEKLPEPRRVKDVHVVLQFCGSDIQIAVSIEHETHPQRRVLLEPCQATPETNPLTT
jgi:hypothetical protein